MLNFSGVVNTLSFGFVNYNILQELYKRELDLNFFLLGGALDLSAYNKTNDAFKAWLILKSKFAKEKYSRNDAEIKIWHIQDSERTIGKNATLMTFFELDSLTATEKNILNNYDKVLVTSKFTKEVFENSGVKSEIIYCPLGFDKTNFHQVNKPVYRDKRCVFSIFGKFEKRKHHEKVIKAWIKRFGKNRNYMLHAHIFNPFWRNAKQDYISTQRAICDGDVPFNVSFQPFVGTMSDFNICLNAASVVIDMSGGEGFSLPSFHAIGLGKHAVIHDCSAMSDWATKENSVLVPSSGKIEVYDNAFFRSGEDFNQGNIFDFDENIFIAACEKAEARWLANPVNKEGLKLQTQYTWEETVNTILQATQK